jgi:hypothetical protein
MDDEKFGIDLETLLSRLVPDEADSAFIKLHAFSSRPTIVAVDPQQ